MLMASQFLCDPSGNILVTKIYDHEEHAKDVNSIRQATDGWTPDRSMRLSFSIPPSEYYRWQDEIGEGCWQDPDFLKFYKAHRPEFSI